MKRITPEMTVREINIRYPACRDVFNEYGMGGCGGTYGPPEPVDFFARAHNVSLDELLAKLEEAAARSQPGAAEATDDEKASSGLYKPFVRAALVATLTLGTAWGAALLTEIASGRSFAGPSQAHIQAHGHAQLYGWVGLFIVGVAYYALPRFKNYPLRRLRLAKGTFFLFAAGILLRSIVQPFADRPVPAALGVASAILELLAIGIFSGIIAEIFIKSTEKREFYEKYLLAGVFWFIVIGVLNVVITVLMAADHSAVARPALNLRFLHIWTVGFITNMILGVSLRILPNFLGLRQPLVRQANLAWFFLNHGVMLKALGIAHPFFGSGMEMAAAVLFVWSLGIFARPVTRVDIQGVDPAFGWFIKLGYGWFLVSVAMILGGDIYQSLAAHPPAHAFVGAYRHALTVGFISTIMLGVAYRILPVFNGTELYSPKAMRASFYLIAVGNAMRVIFQSATMTGIKAFYIPMGASGWLELTALALFSWNIWKSIKDEAEDAFLVDHIVRPETKVADIIELYPELRLALIECGLSHLASIPRPPRFVSLGFAARRHGLDPAQVAATLNEYIRSREEANVA